MSQKLLPKPVEKELKFAHKLRELRQTEKENRNEDPEGHVGNWNTNPKHNIVMGGKRKHKRKSRKSRRKKRKTRRKVRRRKSHKKRKYRTRRRRR